MGLWSWLTGDEWESDGCAPPTFTNTRTGETFSDYDEFARTMRAQDPDYDERQRVQAENCRLKKRRDLLAQQQENKQLRAEIAAMESPGLGTPDRTK